MVCMGCICGNVGRVLPALLCRRHHHWRHGRWQVVSSASIHRPSLHPHPRPHHVPRLLTSLSHDDLPLDSSGVEFGARMVTIDNKQIKLQIWDTVRLPDTPCEASRADRVRRLVKSRFVPLRVLITVVLLVHYSSTISLGILRNIKVKNECE